MEMTSIETNLLNSAIFWGEIPIHEAASELLIGVDPAQEDPNTYLIRQHPDGAITLMFYFNLGFNNRELVEIEMSNCQCVKAHQLLTLSTTHKELIKEVKDRVGLGIHHDLKQPKRRTQPFSLKYLAKMEMARNGQQPSDHDLPKDVELELLSITQKAHNHHGIYVNGKPPMEIVKKGMGKYTAFRFRVSNKKLMEIK